MKDVRVNFRRIMKSKFDLSLIFQNLVTNQNSESSHTSWQTEKCKRWSDGRCTADGGRE